MIYLRKEAAGDGVDSKLLERDALRLLDAVGETGASLSISLVGDEKIRSLNMRYRGKDSPTDVLSFPLADTAREASMERLLGDIVISVPTAKRQAAEYDAPLQNEMQRLMIHGILHLLGHDHVKKNEREKMEAEERRLAAAVGMPWPYD